MYHKTIDVFIIKSQGIRCIYYKATRPQMYLLWSHKATDVSIMKFPNSAAARE